MSLLLRWIINALALIVIANIVPGFGVDGFYAALVASLVLGLVNALIRPILFVLTLPVTVMTLGAFALVVNALMVWLVGTMVKGFHVDGFLPAFLAAFLLWIVSMGTNWLIRQAKET